MLERAIEIEIFSYVTTRGGRGDVSVCSEFARVGKRGELYGHLHLPRGAR